MHAHERTAIIAAIILIYEVSQTPRTPYTADTEGRQNADMRDNRNNGKSRQRDDVDMSTLARMNGMTGKDILALTAAAKVAEKSDYQQRVGAVIVCHGEIVGMGHNENKTDPQQKAYNRRCRADFRVFEYHPHLDGIHAELAAIKSVPWNVAHDIRWNKACIYVVRLAPGLHNGYGMARPCPACMYAIREIGIRHVVYTTNDGIAKETIRPA